MTLSEYQEIYEVVINLEDQYSIWNQRKEIPYGWKKVGKSGTKDECLSYIKEIWIDMRPKSLKDAETKRITKV
jgi:MbtH protein